MKSGAYASCGNLAFIRPILCAVLPLSEEVEEGGQPLDHLARLLTTDRPAVAATENLNAFVDECLLL